MYKYCKPSAFVGISAHCVWVMLCLLSNKTELNHPPHLPLTRAVKPDQSTDAAL